jgi:hypothetical protein
MANAIEKEMKNWAPKSWYKTLNKFKIVILLHMTCILHCLENSADNVKQWKLCCRYMCIERGN